MMSEEAFPIETKLDVSGAHVSVYGTVFAFYAAIPHNDLPIVLSFLKEYSSFFLVTCEICQVSHKATDGEHMHFFMTGSDDSYRNLINRLKKRFQLSGKAVKGAARQYGKIRKLDNVSQYLSYILKDVEPTNPYEVGYMGLTLDTLVKLKAKSYPKVIDEAQKLRTYVVQELDTFVTELYSMYFTGPGCDLFEGKPLFKHLEEQTFFATLRFYSTCDQIPNISRVRMINMIIYFLTRVRTNLYTPRDIYYEYFAR